MGPRAGGHTLQIGEGHAWGAQGWWVLSESGYSRRRVSIHAAALLAPGPWPPAASSGGQPPLLELLALAQQCELWGVGDETKHDQVRVEPVPGGVNGPARL